MIGTPLASSPAIEKSANKKGPCFWHGPFGCWLPIVDEFRNFLMSDEADIIGYQIKDFSVLVEE